eukprot:SAG22_NODE_12279_length_449_cov_0.711429_1_plen_58_part_01
MNPTDSAEHKAAQKVTFEKNWPVMIDAGMTWHWGTVLLSVTERAWTDEAKVRKVTSTR